MEIRVHSQLILARYKGCTNARFILSRSYGHEEFKNANPFWVQKTHKAAQAGQYHRSLHRSIVQSMEIRVHSQLIIARFKGCTNARFILSRSNGHEEFKNVNHFSVQRALKAVQADQYLRSLHRSIVPSMEIRVHSRLVLSWFKGWTKGRCILSRSYGYEEFTNGKNFLGSKGAQSCTGRPISPFHTSQYSALNGNLRAFATNPSWVKRLH